MKLLPLQDVAAQLKPGAPLPWGIRDADGKLLLARGHLVADAEMVRVLLERGMFVDAGEVGGTGSRSEPVPVQKEGFFGRWRLLYGRLGSILMSPADNLGQVIGELAGLLISLVDSDPDKMLFQILRHDQTRLQTYGVSHSLHTAAVCCLTARRMGWDEDQRRSLVGAALTMNVSMIALQGRLAMQATPPTPEQRAEIHSHPQRSVEMLQRGGVTDPLWLLAVAQHHETGDGYGYPMGIADTHEAARMLHYVDVFSAKISARASRPAMLPNMAARDIFTANHGHPLAAALIKEFGIYPPGCFVKLLSGETALVTRRGSNANTPHVACLTNRNGDPLAQPIRRDTAHKDHAIISVTTESNVMVRIPWETLYDRE